VVGCMKLCTDCGLGKELLELLVRIGIDGILYIPDSWELLFLKLNGETRVCVCCLWDMSFPK
jgi:hypothetical protein